MNERLKFKGRLQEKELELKAKKLKIKGLITSIREILDPHEEIFYIDFEVAAAQAIELASTHIDFLALSTEISLLKKEIG